MYLEPGDQTGALIIDGFRADRQALCDFGVAAAFSDEVQYLTLAGGRLHCF